MSFTTNAKIDFVLLQTKVHTCAHTQKNTSGFTA